MPIYSNYIKYKALKFKYMYLLLKTFMRAHKTIESKNWKKLKALTSKLHRAGFAMNQTRFWSGCALLQLKRYDDALSEFEKINGKLDTIEEEASRHWNHALALYHLDRDEECFKLLIQKIDPDWPTKTYWKARRFLASHGFKAFELKV